MAYAKRRGTRAKAAYKSRSSGRARSSRGYAPRKPRRAVKRVRGGGRPAATTLRLEIVQAPQGNPLTDALQARRNTTAPKKAKF